MPPRGSLGDFAEIWLSHELSDATGGLGLGTPGITVLWGGLSNVSSALVWGLKKHRWFARKLNLQADCNQDMLKQLGSSMCWTKIQGAACTAHHCANGCIAELAATALEVIPPVQMACGEFV